MIIRLAKKDFDEKLVFGRIEKGYGKFIKEGIK